MMVNSLVKTLSKELAIESYLRAPSITLLYIIVIFIACDVQIFISFSAVVFAISSFVELFLEISHMSVNYTKNAGLTDVPGLSVGTAVIRSVC